MANIVSDRLRKPGIVLLAIYRNRHQIPNTNYLVDNEALAIIGKTSDPVVFSNIDLKYAYSQIALSETTNPQCSFTKVGLKSRERTGLRPDYTG